MVSPFPSLNPTAKNHRETHVPPPGRDIRGESSRKLAGGGGLVLKEMGRSSGAGEFFWMVQGPQCEQAPGGRSGSRSAGQSPGSRVGAEEGRAAEGGLRRAEEGV